MVGTTFAIGNELVAQASAGTVTARVAVDALSEFRPTENLIADLRAWPHQRDKPVIVLGAHLDSVEEGPGISDEVIEIEAAELALLLEGIDLSHAKRCPRFTPRKTA